jgi:transposase-like protein
MVPVSFHRSINKRTMKKVFISSPVPLQNSSFNITRRKLSDTERWQAVGMVRGGMSYRQTAERFNVSHSVIVRLKQLVNQSNQPGV